MNRQEKILKRNKLINRLIIVLVFVMFLIVGFREFSSFRQNVAFFNNQIHETALLEIKQEVDGRVEEVSAVKAEIESEYLAEVRNIVRDIDFFANYAVNELPVTATLEEKRALYLDMVYQYDLNEDYYLFFSIDLDGVSYLSGLDKNLEGTDISYLQDQITGNYFVVDMIDAVNDSETNEGYVSYYWPNEIGGDHIKKTSYVYYNEDVDLILGTGLYEEDYIEIVQDELFNRISSYGYNTDDYIYIIGYDGTVVYHPQVTFSTDDLLDIKMTSEEPFHQTIISSLEEQDNIYVNYYFEFNDLNQYKTGYIAKIEDWDIYIGRSFIDEQLNIEEAEYIATIVPGIVIFNLTMMLLTLGVVIIIKRVFSQNIHDIGDEFDYKNSLIRKMSFVDYLTGLNNRTYFEDVLGQIAACKENVGIVMADANGLKLINDAYSHAVGDQVLKGIAEILKEIYHDGSVFRWGGDEFLVILENTSEKDLKEREQAFMKKSKERFVNKIQISASLGFHLSMHCDEDVYEMINHAEKRMYEHKMFESLSIKRTIIDNLLNTLYDSFNFEKQHSTNVMKYSVMIGKALNLDKEDIKKLQLAAQLHDIGKISIPDYILTKTEPLTDDEFYEIKLHPEKGYRILSAYPELSEYARYVLYHHERYDGKGYPRGIKGEEIPLFSRIIGVADAFDAMTEERVYKKSRTKAGAIKEIIKYSGTQFDPKLADIFVKALNKK